MWCSCFRHDLKNLPHILPHLKSRFQHMNINSQACCVKLLLGSWEQTSFHARYWIADRSKWGKHQSPTWGTNMSHRVIYRNVSLQLFTGTKNTQWQFISQILLWNGRQLTKLENQECPEKPKSYSAVWRSSSLGSTAARGQQQEHLRTELFRIAVRCNGVQEDRGVSGLTKKWMWPLQDRKSQKKELWGKVPKTWLTHWGLLTPTLACVVL